MKYKKVRFPTLPRFTDPAQQKAAGNIVKFLAALLIVSLAARGTAGATLAKVDVSSPSRAEIIESVTGTASVSARDTLDISAPEGLAVKEMHVGAGQTVKTGDLIARFDPAEVEDKLLQEGAALDKLNLDLEKLERGETVDGTSLESAQRSLDRAREDYETTKSQGEAEVAAAWDALEEALAAVPEGVDSSALDAAYRSLRRAQEDYNIAVNQINSELSDLRAALNTALIIEADKKSAWEAAADQTDPSYGAEAEKAAKAAYDAARSASEAAQGALSAAQTRADDTLLAASRRIEDAESAASKAKSDYDKAVRQVSDSLADEVIKAEANLESSRTRASENLLGASRRIEDAEAALDKARQDYQKSGQSASDTAAQNRISAETLRLDIAAQKEIVDMLQALLDNNCALYAGFDGIVSSAAEEGSVTGKAPFVSFLDSERGFEASLIISKSDAERLAVGDECEVGTGGGSMYYKPTVTGTVSGMSDPDENDRVTVTIRLPGTDWSGGQRVEVQAVQSRDSYDLCVPLSALHSDNSGYFLLTVEQTSTVLGIENLVVRIPVAVRASDENTAAVNGPLDRNSSVITGSNKPIQSGDKVRVND